MNGRFQDKTIVVTGAGQGIGQRVAERMAEEGGQVLIVDRSDARHDVVKGHRQLAGRDLKSYRPA
jgi:NAD(P)-dependent dehydrogenase (short-subunit alcohol dehydrogenase family)